MPDDQIEEARTWYIANQPLYEGLSDIVRSTIESLLKNSKIDHLSVSCRTKTLDSFSEKVKRKSYKDPDENTDFSGIRIITYIESDVTKACEVIRESFNVHPELSFDKTDELGVDRFGYRSVHFVCDLGSQRAKLPEFKLYKDLKFEVQVRTVLQHAWAEIEHDRNYKFSGILPTPLRRRLYTLAGLLEIVDREFVALSDEVDKYSEDVAEQTKAGNLNIEINTTSLMQFLPEKLSKVPGLDLEPLSGPSKIEQVTTELRDFGAKTLNDLDQLLTHDFLTGIVKNDNANTYVGLLREAMMYADIDRYFDSAWQNHWAIRYESIDRMLKEKYGAEKLRKLWLEKKIVVHPGTFSTKRFKSSDT